VLPPASHFEHERRTGALRQTGRPDDDDDSLPAMTWLAVSTLAFMRAADAAVVVVLVVVVVVVSRLGRVVVAVVEPTAVFYNKTIASDKFQMTVSSVRQSQHNLAHGTNRNKKNNGETKKQICIDRIPHWKGVLGTSWLAGRDILDVVNVIRKAAARGSRAYWRSINSTLFATWQQRCVCGYQYCTNLFT